MPKEEQIYTNDNGNQHHNVKYDRHVPCHFYLPFKYINSRRKLAACMPERPALAVLEVLCVVFPILNQFLDLLVLNGRQHVVDPSSSQTLASAVANFVFLSFIGIPLVEI
jgi:hypothetical protein